MGNIPTQGLDYVGDLVRHVPVGYDTFKALIKGDLFISLSQVLKPKFVNGFAPPRESYVHEQSVIHIVW